MKPAQDRLEPELRALSAHVPRVPVVANVDAELKRDAASSIDALVAQVSSRVRWVDVVQRLAAEGVTHYIEVGPGTVLAGFIKRIQKDAHIVNFSAPEHLEAVLAACSS
jgi:[acyl-carrier-protein] S-malonyltransferase